MGIREALNKNKTISTAVAGTLIAGGLLYAYFGLHTASSTSVSAPRMAYYSTDDGKTWFEEGVYRAFPFDDGGRKAYRAVVIQCAGSGPRVAYLMRMPDAAFKESEDAMNNGDPDFPAKYQKILDEKAEVRKPGTAQWVAIASAEGKSLVTEAVKCPDGSTGQSPAPTGTLHQNHP